jgi:hypothetical protein
MPLSNAERQLRFRRRQQERRAAALDLWDVPIKLDAVMARYEPLLPGWRGACAGGMGLASQACPSSCMTCFTPQTTPARRCGNY